MSNEQDFFDKIASCWDSTRLADTEKITQLIDKTGLEQGFNVLDAGCGTGILLPFIKQAVGLSGRVTAVDFSANMLAKAKEKYGGLGGITFTVADIMEFEPDGKLDAVLCFNFFPHIKEKQLFMKHMRRHLRAGGFLTIMHDISRHQVNAIHQGSEAVKDDRLATGETVSKWLLDAGYQVAEVIDAEDRYFIKAVKSG